MALPRRTDHPGRYAARRRLFILASAATLAGCGFHLQQPLRYPFGRIALVGFAPNSPLESELRRALTAAGVQVSAASAQAEVVLRALTDRRERSVAASTAFGQVRELQLRLRVTVRADTPAGRALMPPVELRLSRDLSTTESATLAKRQEEAELYREMQSDVVTQLLRRLAALSP
jgi:LPS-assembly lipoprotein